MELERLSLLQPISLMGCPVMPWTWMMTMWICLKIDQGGTNGMSFPGIYPRQIDEELIMKE